MEKKGQLRESVGQFFLIVVVFILGGTGLSILFNAGRDAVNIIGGFALIGIAIAIIKKLI